jgi:hypothetical protein
MSRQRDIVWLVAWLWANVALAMVIIFVLHFYLGHHTPPVCP